MKTINFENVEPFSYETREALRTLRTNIKFSGDDIKVIMVTSTAPDEGKSSVSFNLARSLTELGKNVLLIDTDMRKSVLVGRLKATVEGGDEIYGLSHYLSGQKMLDESMYMTNIDRLYMMFAGPSVPNPTELLEKRYFGNLIRNVREKFDYVVVDTSPMGAAIDAAIIAAQCDGSLIVVAQGQESSKAINATKSQIESAGGRILGVVLNKVNSKKAGYGKYYGRYYGKYYGKYYGHSKDKTDKKKSFKKKVAKIWDLD